MIPLAYLVIEAERDAELHAPKIPTRRDEHTCTAPRPSQNFFQRIFAHPRPQPALVCTSACH